MGSSRLKRALAITKTPDSDRIRCFFSLRYGISLFNKGIDTVNWM